MPTTIAEELKTFFTGDSKPYEEALKRVQAVTKGQEKVEKDVAARIARIRKQSVLDAATAPIRAKIAADRKAEADAEEERGRAAKRARQEQASSASNIVRELRSKFGENAKKKIGGHLQNTLGLSEDAAEGLVGKLGRAAPYITLAATAGTVLIDTLRRGANFAGEQAEKMAALNEEMRQTSAVNVFASSADGVDALSDRLKGALEEVRKAREAQKDNDPYGFGGGVLGNAQTALAKRFQGAYDFFNDSPFEKQRREQENLAANEKIKGQEVGKLNRARELTVGVDLARVRQSLSASQQEVAITDLLIAKQKELSSAKFATLSADEKAKVANKYDLQIRAQIELQGVMEARQNLAMGIAGLENIGLTRQQQSVAAAQMRNAELEEELQNRQALTTEERRSLELQRAGNQNEIRAAQFAKLSESPAQQNRDAIAQTRREARIQRQQDILNRTDGLRNIERDTSGNIVGGVDIVTGQRRAVSSNFVQQSGLTTGGLTTGGLDRPAFDHQRNVKFSGGDNDQSAGKTLLSAAQASVEAQNISNDYLKQIQIDITSLVANYGFS